MSALPVAALRATEHMTILVVEDDPGIARLERRRLERAGYATAMASSATEALHRVAEGGIDLIVLDHSLPGRITGLELYAQLKDAGHDLPVIIVTGNSSEATVIRALRLGVRDFVTKSLEYLDYLPEAVGRVLSRAASSPGSRSPRPRGLRPAGRRPLQSAERGSRRRGRGTCRPSCRPG